MIDIKMNIAELKADIAELKADIAELKKIVEKQAVRVQWEESVTDTGIQIQGSTASVTKTGRVISTSVLPVSPGQIDVVHSVIRDGDNGMTIISAKACKFL